MEMPLAVQQARGHPNPAGSGVDHLQRHRPTLLIPCMLEKRNGTFFRIRRARRGGC